MTSRLSDRERAIRAKMVARYQSKKQLEGGIGNDKCDAKSRTDGGNDEEVANAENRNTANVSSITISGATPSSSSGQSQLRRVEATSQLNNNRCSSSSAKSLAPAAAMAKSTLASKKTVPSISTTLANESICASATEAETAPVKTKERTSLSDAKRKLAASRIAIAATPTTPRGQQQPSTPKGTSTTTVILSPRTSNFYTSGTRSFSTSPRPQPMKQQQPQSQPQSNAMSLKAQRERFLRIKQYQSPGMSDNKLVPSSPSSLMSASVAQSNMEEQVQQLPSIQPMQTVEHTYKLQHFLAAKERVTPTTSFTQILSTASTVTNTTAKQQMRMQIIHQHDDNTHIDDDGGNPEGVATSKVLSEVNCEEKPQVQKWMQPQPSPKQEVSPNRAGGPSRMNATYVSSQSSDSQSNSHDFHFDGESSDDYEDEDDLLGEIDATVSDPSLQLDQSTASTVGCQDSGDDNIIGDDDDGDGDNDDFVLTINSVVGEMKVSSVLERKSSDVESEECHIGNVAFESECFNYERDGIAPVASSTNVLPPTDFDDSDDDAFAFKMFDNNESIVKAHPFVDVEDSRVLQGGDDKNPKDSEDADRDVGNDNDNDVFENAWPEDSFSPTAWGVPQPESSFGESSDQWNAHFSQSRSSEASGRDGWKGSELKVVSASACNGTPAHQQTEDEVIEENVPTEANTDNSPPDESDKDVVESEVYMEWNASDSAAEHHGDMQHTQEAVVIGNHADQRMPSDFQKIDQYEQSDHIMVDWKSTTSSASYVGFGGVLSSGKLSCTESRDDDDEENVDQVFLSDDDDSDGDMISRAGSEETVGTATEFDPRSMFGEELDDEDDFDAAPNDTFTVVNETTHTAASKLVSNTTITPTADSPTGTESLGSWWQSRHALTQNSDINSAVQEALMKRVVFDRSQSDDNHKESLREAFALQAVDETTRIDDEDSIFSGLEDPMAIKAHGVPTALLPLNAANNVTTAFARSTQIDEDVFSGVSVTSRQELSTSQFPRLKEANAMKSLLDGTSTTADSPSFQHPPLHQCVSAEQHADGGNDAHGMTVTDGISKPSNDPFSSNEGYGVINFQKIYHSPTNASVTSDITSSVIFGSGDFRKPSFMKPLDILETTIETFDQELLADRSVHDQPTATLEKIEFAENPHEVFFVEITNPIRSKDQMTPLPGNDFSKLTSRGSLFVDSSPSASTTRPNGALSHLKAQLLSKAVGQRDDEITATADGPQNKCPDGKTMSEAVNKAKLAFLSRLSCGAFAASSYAFCASDSERITSPKEQEVERNIDFKMLDQLDAQLVVRSNSESCGSGSVCSKDRKLIQVESEVQSSESTGTGTALSKDADDQFNSKSYSNSVDESETTDKGSNDGSSDSSDDNCIQAVSQVSSDDGASLPSRYTESRDDTDSRTETGQNSVNSVARSNAYHNLLLYAYTALSVPPPSEVVEKGGDFENDHIMYPPVLSTPGTLGRFEEMSKILERLSNEGIEVLKLNREKNWQPRFLTITKEVMWFRKTNDLRFRGIDSCPRGLLWVKRFDQDKEHSISSINKNGQGGVLFSAIQYISLMKDKHSLSRKQKKGKFKDSVTLVLHACSNESKREIMFRCMNKDDAFALSSAFQAILDRLDNDNLNQKSRIGQLKVDVKTMESMGRHPNPRTPLALSKAFSPKVNVDRWEL